MNLVTNYIDAMFFDYNTFLHKLLFRGYYNLYTCGKHVKEFKIFLMCLTLLLIFNKVYQNKSFIAN